jgi:sulfur carrier protein
MLINIYLNGLPQEINLTEGTLAELLAHNGILPDQKGIAVAVNMEVVPRTMWSATMIQAGDRVEIVQARQGG